MSNLTPQALFYMLLLSFQFGLQPVLVRRFTDENINRTSVVMMQECIKFVLCFIILGVRGEIHNATKGWNIWSWIKVALVPAALYSVQNMAALIAYQNLDPLTFSVLNQTKTISAAVCCYLILGRKQSYMQVFSLLMLFASVIIFQEIDFKIKFDYSEQVSSTYFTHGIGPILLASFISGLAGSISQKSLQLEGRNSFLFSMELCVASIIFYSFNLKLDQTLFDHWTFKTFIPILTNALGGILVGLVNKYAGSVRKGFSLICGLCISGFFSKGVSYEKVIGASLAACSLLIHSSFPIIEKDVVIENPKQKKKKSLKEE